MVAWQLIQLGWSLGATSQSLLCFDRPKMITAAACSSNKIRAIACNVFFPSIVWQFISTLSSLSCTRLQSTVVIFIELRIYIPFCIWCSSFSATLNIAKNKDHRHMFYTDLHQFLNRIQIMWVATETLLYHRQFKMQLLHSKAYHFRPIISIVKYEKYEKYTKRLHNFTVQICNLNFY